MRVLILGGTQFVGRHIVEALLAAGHHVSILSAAYRLTSSPRTWNGSAATATTG